MFQILLDAFRIPRNEAIIAIPEKHKVVPSELFEDFTNQPKGTLRFENLKSLVDYTLHHAGSNTCVFASLDNQRIESVIDWLDNKSDDGNNWGEHRAKYDLRTTKQWVDWTGISGKVINQKQFAEFIEEHLDEISEPSAADVLTIATSLSGKRNVNFTNATDLGNGDKSIQWEEKTEAKGAGDIRVPSRIKLAIPVFRGAEEETKFEVQALFRYRIDNGGLTFEIKLLHADRVLEMAFDQVVEALGDQLNVNPDKAPKVLMGSVTEFPRAILSQRTITNQ